MKKVSLKVNSLFENSKLTFIEDLPSGKRGGRSIRRVLCRCECGVLRPFILSDIHSGGSKTCGECSFGKVTGIATRDYVKVTCSICSESSSIQESKRRALVKRKKLYRCKPCTGILNAVALNKKYKKLPLAIAEGQLFGMLKVITEVAPSCFPSGKKLRRFEVLCTCGIRKEALLIHLQSGKIRSCGCARDSKPEKEMYEYIKTLLPNTTILRNDRKILGGLELDVYLPEYKIGIEYNGNYWHSEKFDKNKKRHFKKRIFSESKGIRLIQIRSDEWHHKKLIIQSMLKAILGILPQRHFARKLVLRKVKSKDANKFLIDNHLIGACGTAVSNIGLYTSEDILVQLFSYQIKGADRSTLECTRICSLREHSIVGGVSKLMKGATTKNPSLKRIVSFVDQRYADGRSLIKLGFVENNIALGWGWTDGKKWFNRRSCRANMDSRKLTQAQHAEELGWHKLYDAGQAKFTKEIVKS